MTPMLYSLKKYLLGTYDVPGILLGSRDIGNNREQNKQGLALKVLEWQGKWQSINKTLHTPPCEMMLSAMHKTKEEMENY